MPLTKSISGHVPLGDSYLGAAVLESYRRSGEATLPLDQVMRNHGLEV